MRTAIEAATDGIRLEAAAAAVRAAPAKAPVRLLQGAVVLVGVAAVAFYVVIALLRLGYPFELEWLEGSMVEQSLRIAEGKPLYVKPSLEFVPFIYAPLYFEVCALLAGVLGPGFVPLRLVSLVASLGCMALLFWLVARETGSRAAGFVAAALFAATFGRSGGMLDVGRVDSLLLVLVLAGSLVLRSRDALVASTIAGVGFALALQTKQSALVVMVPLVLWLLATRPRQALAFGLAFALPTAVAWWLRDAATQGWYSFYNFELPRLHPILSGAWLGFWRQDMLGALPVGCALAAIALALQLARRGDSWRTRLFWPALTIGLLGCAWSARLHHGGGLNVLAPAHAAIAASCGLLLGRVQRPMPRLLVLLATLLQLAWLGLALDDRGRHAYDPRSYLPTAADQRAGERLLETLRALDGEVLIPHHALLARLAGKAPTFHTAALWDVLRAQTGTIGAELEAEVTTAIASKRFAAVVLDDAEFPFYCLAFPFHYRHEREVMDDPSLFFTVTGPRNRPQHLWVRR